MKKPSLLILLVFIPLITFAYSGADDYGFFWGIWHGVTLFFRVFIYIFNSDTIIFAYNNTGIGYNFGYMFGVAIAFGGAASANS